MIIYCLYRCVVDLRDSNHLIKHTLRMSLIIDTLESNNLTEEISVATWKLLAGGGGC